MAKKVAVSGPLTKGYDDKEPILNSSEVGGVLLVNGMQVNRETKMLEIPFYGDRDNPTDDPGEWAVRKKLLPLGEILNPISLIYKGLQGPRDEVITGGGSASYTAAALRDYAAKMSSLEGVSVNSFFRGARVGYDLTPDSFEADKYYIPWILIGSGDFPDGYKLNVMAIGGDEQGEDDTANWVKVGEGRNSPSGAKDSLLFVRTIEVQKPSDVSGNPVFIFRSFREGV